MPVGAGAVTWARNLMLVLVAMSICPPVVALAPVPRRATILRVAATYSIWSSFDASDLLPALGPVTTESEPAT